MPCPWYLPGPVPPPPDPVPEALLRYARDSRLADDVLTLRMQEREAPKLRQWLHEWLTSVPTDKWPEPGRQQLESETAGKWLRAEVEGCWAAARPWSPEGLTPVWLPAWWSPPGGLEPAAQALGLDDPTDRQASPLLVRTVLRASRRRTTEPGPLTSPLGAVTWPTFAAGLCR